MHLRSLKLWNFRRFREVAVEFPDGVIGIIGQNGVGKSTLIEAIAWAIYGHPASRTKKEQIKRIGAAPSDPCGVLLEFYLGRDEYRIKREMLGQNLVPKAELMVNGEVIAEGERQVTAHLESIIGLDHQSFITSVFARQRELNALSLMGPEERKRLILKMLNIDVIKRALEELRSDKNENRKRMEGIKEAIIDENGIYRLDNLKKERKSCIERKKEIIERQKREKNLLYNCKIRLENLKAEVREMEEKLEAHNNLKQEMVAARERLENRRRYLQELERSINTLLGKKKRLDSIADDEKRYHEFGEKKERLENELRMAQERYDKIKRAEFERLKEVEHLQKRLKEITLQKEEIYLELKALKEADSKLLRLQPIVDVIQELEELMKLREERDKLKEKIDALDLTISEKELEEFENELKTLQKKEIILSTRLKDLTGRIRRVETITGVCPTCSRALDDREKQRIIDRMLDEQERINDELGDVRERIARLSSLDLHTIRLNLDLFKTTSRRLTAIADEESAIMASIGGDHGIKGKAEIQEIRDEYQRLKGRVDARSNLNETFDILNSEIVRVKQRIGELNDEIEDIAAKKREYRRGVESLQDSLSAVVLRFKELEKSFNEIIGLKAEIKRLDELKNTFKDLKVEISEIEAHILSIKKEIDAIGFDKEKYERLRKNEEEVERECHKLEQNIALINNELSLVEYELKSIEEGIKEQNRLINLMDELKAEVASMVRLEEIFKHFEAHMISSIRPFLSDYASTLFSDLTEGRYNGIEIGEAYDIMIQDSGRYYDLKRFSGGETDLANLCLRLAISNIVSGGDEGAGFEFLVLDEIFGSQDSERKRSIMRVLEKLSRRFRQIFLITHVEEVKDFLGSFIKVIEVEERISGVEVG